MIEGEYPCKTTGASFGFEAVEPIAVGHCAVQGGRC